MTREPARRRAPRIVVGLVAAAVLVPVILFGLAAWNDYNQAMRRAEHDAERAVATLQEHASKVFETQELILDRIAERVQGMEWDAIRAAEASLHAYLRQMRLPQVFNIMLLDEQGRSRVNALQSPGPDGFNVADRPYFSDQRSADQGTYIDGVIKGRLTGTLTFHASRRLTRPDGTFAGVIALAMSPDYFATFWRSFAPERDHVVSMVRDDGAVLARHPAWGSEPLRLLPESALMRAMRTGKAGLFHGRSPRDGITRVMAYKRLDQYPLVIAYGYGYPTILRGWYRNLVFYGLAASLAAVALVLAIRSALKALSAEQKALLRLSVEKAQRERAEAALQHAQKLEALGTLTSEIAHDLGNFLQAIILNLQVLKGRLGPEWAEARVEASLEASRRAVRLRKRLLAFARRQPLDPAVLDLNRVVEDLVPILVPAVGSRNTLEKRLADDLWPTVLDKGQLEVALLNLVVNAKHALPAPGTVTIATQNVRLTPAAAVEGLVGDFVTLAVSDTGTGMPPDVIARAFEPFFTTKEAGSGTGLGLAGVSSLAKACGGTVTIRSGVGQGTTVTLYLPRAAQAASSHA